MARTVARLSCRKRSKDRCCTKTWGAVILTRMRTQNTRLWASPVMNIWDCVHILSCLHWVLTCINSVVCTSKLWPWRETFVSFKNHICQLHDFIHLLILAEEMREFSSTGNKAVILIIILQDKDKSAESMYIIFHMFCLFRGLWKFCSSYVSLGV
jgi:hypothetical protein